MFVWVNKFCLNVDLGDFRADLRILKSLWCQDSLSLFCIQVLLEQKKDLQRNVVTNRATIQSQRVGNHVEILMEIGNFC